jgi:hypothetical protein
MDSRQRRTGHRRRILGLVAGVALLFGFATTSFAQSEVEGLWAVLTTPRDCTTGAALGPPVRALMTFHQGGTTTETEALLLFAPGQRSIGHGVWSHTGGLTFRQRTVTMILFDGGPFQAGWTLTTQNVVLSDPNNFTSTGSTGVYDTNRQFLRTICASRTGERFR